MTFQEFIDAYDQEGSVVLLEGKRTVLTTDAPILTALGKQLAESTRWMRFRSGNAPGADALGSPIVVRAELPLPNHKTLVISTKNQSPTNVYVKEVRWNGKVLKTPFVDHNELVQGGTLEFLMNDKPNHD